MDAVELFENTIRGVIEENKLRNFEAKIFLNKSKMKTLKGYLKWSVIEGLFLMIFGMIVFAQFIKIEEKLDLFALIAIACFFAPFALNYLFVDIVFEKRKRQKEELLSDLLLEASVFCDGTSSNQIIKRISESDFPLLKEDFVLAYKEINNGASTEEALLHIKELNQSKTYSRVIDLFIQGYKSGAKLSQILKETAEDLLESKAIIKERQAVMLVTKYTLLLAAGIIVPAILGSIIGLVSGLNFDSLGDLSFGISAEERKLLFLTAINGTTIYVLEYSLISSFFLALQEGNKKNFWIYALVLVPISLLIFFTAKSFN